MKDPDAFDIIRMVIQNRRQEEIADFLGITQSACQQKDPQDQSYPPTGRPVLIYPSLRGADSFSASYIKWSFL